MMDPVLTWLIIEEERKRQDPDYESPYDVDITEIPLWPFIVFLITIIASGTYFVFIPMFIL